MQALPTTSGSSPFCCSPPGPGGSASSSPGTSRVERPVIARRPRVRTPHDRLADRDRSCAYTTVATDRVVCGLVIEERLTELGIVLPPVMPPAGNYVRCVVDGTTL